MPTEKELLEAAQRGATTGKYNEDELRTQAAWALDRARRGEAPTPNVQGALSAPEGRAVLTDPAERIEYDAYQQVELDKQASKEFADKVFSSPGERAVPEYVSESRLIRDARADGQPPSGPATKAKQADEQAAREVTAGKASPNIPMDEAANPWMTAGFGGQQGGGVVVTPGGMVPERITRQVEQGPQLPDEFYEQLREFELNKVMSASKESTARLQRDQAVQGLLGEKFKAQTRFIGEEQRALQGESDQLSEARTRMQEALKGLQGPIETPHDRMQKWDAGKKVGFLMASVLGNFGASRRGGTNTFLQSYNKFMEQDMEKLRMEQQQKRDAFQGAKSVYDVLERGFNSDRAAREALRAMYWQALETKVASIAQQYNIDTADARYKEILSGINKEMQDALLKATSLSGAKVTTQASEKYVPPRAVRTGGPKLTEEKFRELATKYSETRQKMGLPELENTVDLFRRAIANSDPGVKQFITDYMSTHPGGEVSNALRALFTSNDPQAKKRAQSLTSGVLTMIRSTGGKALTITEKEAAQLEANPYFLPELYDTLSNQYLRNELEAQASIGPDGPAVAEIMNRIKYISGNKPGSVARIRQSDQFDPATQVPADLAPRAP